MRKSLLAIIFSAFLGCSPIVEEAPVDDLIKTYRGPCHEISPGQGFETLGYGFTFTGMMPALDKSDKDLFYLEVKRDSSRDSLIINYGERYCIPNSTKIFFGIKKQTGTTIGVVVDSASVFEADSQIPQSL
jgi:hypothetical protein